MATVEVSDTSALIMLFLKREMSTVVKWGFELQRTFSCICTCIRDTHASVLQEANVFICI